MKQHTLYACTFLLFIAFNYGCSGLDEVEYYAPVESSMVQPVSEMRGLKEIAKFRVSKKIDFYVTIFEEKSFTAARVIFQLPDGEAVRFKSSSVLITGPAGEHLSAGEISFIEGIYKEHGRAALKRHHPQEHLIGASVTYRTFSGKTVQRSRQFEVNIKFEKRLPNLFKLRLPTIDLSGSEIYFPDIEFKRTKGMAYTGAAP